MTIEYLVDTADITWQDGVPYSEQYGDIYWDTSAAESGSPLDEKAAVFLAPVRRMTEGLKSGTQYTICELGFGFGINCLLATDYWKNLPKGCQLNFVSIEKHPVTPLTLGTLLSRYSFTGTTPLLSGYPPPVRGQHVLWLADNVRLLLIFEDINTALGNLDAQVDMWFLDGFAPSRNEAMWQAALYGKMFSRSRPGAEIATYSAAGDVRRGLEQSGFNVSRIKGYGRKKEMLKATRPGNWVAARHGGHSVTILGAGLAGVFCAEAMTKRSQPFAMIDSGQPGPSHIPQLSVMPQLAAAAETRYLLSIAAAHYMRSAPGFHATGIQRHGRDPEEAARLTRIASQFPDDYLQEQNGSIVYHQAGWLAFEELKATFPARPICAEIEDIQRDIQAGSPWRCYAGGRQIATSDQLILATGFNRSLLPGELQVRAVRGHAVTVATANVTQVLNHHATVFPTHRGRSVISGTYSLDTGLEANPIEVTSLLDDAEPLITFDRTTAEPWVGIRAVARDRFPIVGQAPDWARLRDTNRLSDARYFQEGLHYCTAFGSRGATHARLCAEHLVSKLLGEPAALGLTEQRLLSPARFVFRDRESFS